MCGGPPLARIFFACGVVACERTLAIDYVIAKIKDGVPSLAIKIGTPGFHRRFGRMIGAAVHHLVGVQTMPTSKGFVARIVVDANCLMS